jgi:hypothetical protein
MRYRDRVLFSGKPRTVTGVDGCAGGWVAVTLPPSCRVYADKRTKIKQALGVSVGITTGTPKRSNW